MPPIYRDPSGNIGFERSDLVRIVAKFLGDMGYKSTALQLEAESGVKCQPSSVSDALNSIVQGQYERALQLIRHLKLNTTIAHVEMLILERKFVEYIEQEVHYFTPKLSQLNPKNTPGPAGSLSLSPHGTNTNISTIIIHEYYDNHIRIFAFSTIIIYEGTGPTHERHREALRVPRLSRQSLSGKNTCSSRFACCLQTKVGKCCKGLHLTLR